MRCPSRFWSQVPLALTVAIVFVALARSNDPPSPETRAAAKAAYGKGNYKDAYEAYRNLALWEKNDPTLVGDDLAAAIQSLRQLGRTAEIDELREAVIAVHSQNWRLLLAAAESFSLHENFGYVIAGKFERGHHRGGRGDVVNSAARDRVRALQLLVQAMDLIPPGDAADDGNGFFLSFAQVLLGQSHGAWRLQTLTDLAQLPDYDPGWYYGRGAVGAPVDETGQPVYYRAPRSWKEAANDGERWRWCLDRAVEVSVKRLNQTRYALAQFMQSQIGEQTMAHYGWYFARAESSGGKQDESGTYALHTLGEDETIAQLATGIKRFKLPDEFNYIRIYQRIVADPATGYAPNALEALAGVFENRRQYPKAAEHWRRLIALDGPGGGNYRQARLDQIVNNWGSFESSESQPAGTGATVEYRFRNGNKVRFTAQRIDEQKLLQDVMAYLKGNPPQLDGNRLNIGDLGWLVIQGKQEQYLGEKVAEWDLDLEPRPEHFDRRITVTTPLQKAGAYLVTAQMDGGNATHIVLWLADLAILKKPLGDKAYYYVADAVTGQPVPKANLELFGYRQRQVENKKQFTIDVRHFADHCDKDGQAVQVLKDDDNQFQWIAAARTNDGRLAWLGFTRVWKANYHDAEYNQVKVFSITDRPVYRPEQQVQFKFWVRHARYDEQELSDFAGRSFNLEIRDPQGTVIHTQSFRADEYGGFDGTFDLPKDAKLGVYQLHVVHHGGGSFRVEEYKKPEFDVTVEAPTEPVMLGEKIAATIKAKYYFGSPVTEARVHYKVTRTSHTQRWYAPSRWDWFYEPGYWWFAYDYDWYPGFGRWGCRRPSPWWFGRSYQPPEVVADAEVPIGPDGSVRIEIDTAVAKEVHGDTDHQYQIVAEVTDASRRTITGTGQFGVAREPFKVFAWVNRGYFRAGDTVTAHFQAQTLDHKPIKGQGRLKLLRISYNERQQPEETVAQEWELDTSAQGQAEQKFVAAKAGQYRLAYAVTDDQGHTIEGGYLFTVIGQGFASENFRFESLELIPDEREYGPGQKVRLLINTNRADSTVLLFLRPAHGVYLPPQLVKVQGKSTVAEFDVATKDMPNFFVEAVTIADGKLHTQLREIIVPPAQRTLAVDLEPSQQEYLPGQAAEVKLTLRGEDGRPFVGTTALSIYDKSVEYISGGSNVPAIREYFWKWRRSHYSQGETSLGRYLYALLKPGDTMMQNLGVFGGTVDEESTVDRLSIRTRGPQSGGRGRANRRRAMNGLAGEQDAAKAGEDRFATLEKAQNEEGEFAGEPGPGAAAMVQPAVRQNFADTAFWAGAISTDGDGVATVKLTMPENLTAWKIKAWGMGHGTKCGEGSAEVVTRKNLLVRLQAPRFFVERDEVVLSANVHNYLPRGKSVQVALELEGGVLAATGETVKTIEIDAAGEKRVDWLVRVTGEGQATVRMKALTDEESDAMQMSFPSYVHGMLKFESFSGMLRQNENAGAVKLRVPAERRVHDTRLEVRYSPTLAGAMVDALPYMVEYPYGCTEQTLNRFLPTVVTQRILIRMGLDLNAIRDKRANLNAQEIGDPAERARGWKRFDRNPVFDEEEVRAMVKDGVQKLTEMQLSDGGWGWFSGWGEHSWPHTTAVVVHGLQVAQENDVALVPGLLDRGVQWLSNYQAGELQKLKNAPEKKRPWKDVCDNLDALVFMVLVDAGQVNAEMKEFLYRDRTHLAVYSKAMCALAMHKAGDVEKRDMLRRNIEQFLVVDDENQTAWLKLPEDNYWWYWYGSEIEAQSYYLKLLAKVDPEGATAPRLVKYLLNNRKHATYWNSTRDSAVAIEALAEYLVASGEDRPDLAVEVWLNGKKQKEVKINKENLFTFDDRLVLVGDAVETGQHTLELKKQGKGPLYYNAYLTNFTLEEHIERAGLEIKVNRKLYRLKRVDKSEKVAGSRGQAVDQRVEKYVREEIPNLGELTSGELCEVELEIDSKNDYEYLIFEDMKAAGFEPVDVRSGYTGNALGAYVEFRDNRVSFFTRALARGKHSVSYRLRAEIPGKFSALPARASAMYAPELKGNSDEIKVRVVE